MNFFNWFSGGDPQYMDSIHSMNHDMLWVSITIFLYLAVFLGYIGIAIHWWRSQRYLPDGPAKTALWRMVMIFLFCGSGYLMLVVRMFWPARRLADILTATLIWFTFRYLFGTQGLLAVYTQLGQTHRLQIDLESFTAMSDNLPVVIWATDEKGSVEYVNKQWIDYTGLTLEQSKGTGWKALIHADDLGKCLDAWTNSLATGNQYEVEYRLRAKDGSWKWFIGRALPMLASDGKIKRWYGSCTEIEDQKALSLNLLNENDSLRRLKQLTDEMNSASVAPSVKKPRKRKPQ